MSGWAALIPETLVAMAAVALLLARRLAPGWTATRRRRLPLLGAAVLGAALVIELTVGGGLASLFRDGWVQDRFALYAKGFVLAAAAVLLLVGERTEFEDEDLRVGTALLGVLGAMIAASAATLAGLWAGGELAAIATLTAASGHRPGATSRLLPATILAGALVAIGFALVYATAGVSILSAIPAHLPAGYPTGPLTVAVVLVLAGLSVRLLLVPFQFAGVDALLGATPLGAGLLGGVGASAAAVVLVKFAAAVSVVAGGWAAYLAVVAAVAIVAGAAGALGARTPRALVAWLGLSQVGWIAAGVAMHTALGITAAIYLLGAYLIAACTAPGLVAESGLRGLALRSPAPAAAFALAVLSLAGTPPLAGWFGEFTVALELVRNGYAWLLPLGLLAGVLSLVAAVRALWSIFLAAPAEEVRPEAVGAPLLAGSLAAAAILAGLGFFANPVHELARQGAEALGLFR